MRECTTSLYFPFRVSADGKSLFSSFLKHYVAADIDSLETIELEYAGEGELHPSRLLGGFAKELAICIKTPVRRLCSKNPICSNNRRVVPKKLALVPA